MARACVAKQRGLFEPLYERDPLTGGTLELFYAHRVLAQSFRAQAGWFWWVWPPNALPDGPPNGPFGSSYAAYRDARTTDILGPLASPVLPRDH
jgi:hypothetical protein